MSPAPNMLEEMNNLTINRSATAISDSDFSDKLSALCGTDCTRCGKQITLQDAMLQCGKCKVASYCGIMCFNEDLSTHREFCAAGNCGTITKENMTSSRTKSKELIRRKSFGAVLPRASSTSTATCKLATTTTNKPDENSSSSRPKGRRPGLSDWGRTKSDAHLDTFLKDQSFWSDECTACGKHINNNSGWMMQCAKCKLVYYCSAKCFNDDMPNHKQICQSGGKINTNYKPIDNSKWDILAPDSDDEQEEKKQEKEKELEDATETSFGSDTQTTDLGDFGSPIRRNSPKKTLSSESSQGASRRGSSKKESKKKSSKHREKEKLKVKVQGEKHSQRFEVKLMDWSVGDLKAELEKTTGIAPEMQKLKLGDVELSLDILSLADYKVQHKDTLTMEPFIASIPRRPPRKSKSKSKDLVGGGPPEDDISSLGFLESPSGQARKRNLVKSTSSRKLDRTISATQAAVRRSQLVRNHSMPVVTKADSSQCSTTAHETVSSVSASPSIAGGRKIPILVKTIGGRSADLTVRTSDTVDDLKARIEETLGMAPEAQHLYLDGDEELGQGDWSLRQCGVSSNCLILVKFVENAALKLKIHLPSKRKLKITVHLHDDIETIKQEIERQEGIPSTLQKLLHAGSRLEELLDGRKVIEYGLDKKSMIYMEYKKTRTLSSAERKNRWSSASAAQPEE